MFRTTLDLHAAQVNRIYEPVPFNRAEMKFYSFVAVDNAMSLPQLDALLQLESPNELMDGLRPAIAEVADHIWESVQISHVRKRHRFSFGDTGRALLNVQSPEPPTQIDWILLLIEVDEDVRGLGARAQELVASEHLEEIAHGIAGLASVPFGRTAMAAFTIAKFLIDTISAILVDSRNKQVGYIDQSFLRDDDFGVGRQRALHGERIQDLTANMWYDYSLTVIRD